MEKHILETIRENEKIAQSSLFKFHKLLGSEKKLRAAVNRLQQQGLIEKETAKNGAVSWVYIKKRKDDPQPNLLDEVIENSATCTSNEFAEQELVTAFKVAGMTEARAKLMTKKVISGELTEERVMEEWLCNPSNPNKKGSAKPELASKLKKKQDEVKAKKKTAKKETKVPVAKYTRQDALAAVLKDQNGSTKETIILAANALYVANGGKDNVKESTWVYNTSIKILIGIGALRIDEEGKHHLNTI